MRIEITVKKVAKAFKIWAVPYNMDDWNDLEERRNKLGDFLAVIDYLSGNSCWPSNNKDWVILN
jgi:hypothetical protein